MRCYIRMLFSGSAQQTSHSSHISEAEYRAQMAVVFQKYGGNESEDPTLSGDLKKRVRLCELFYIVAVSG